LIQRKFEERLEFNKSVPSRESIENIKRKALKGLCLSGAQPSVYAEDTYRPDNEIWNLGLPILGICYGMQVDCSTFWRKVVPADHHEYGKANSKLLTRTPLFLEIFQIIVLFG